MGTYKLLAVEEVFTKLKALNILEQITAALNPLSEGLFATVNVSPSTDTNVNLARPV